MQTRAFPLSLAALTSVLWLAACSTPASRIEQNPQIFSQLSPNDQALVRAGRVGIGMGVMAVRLALGDPDRVTTVTDASGTSEIWHYEQDAYYDGSFLYPGPYWRGGRRGFWGGGYWGPGPWGDPFYDYPTMAYDRFRITFTGGRVSSIRQEGPR